MAQADYYDETQGFLPGEMDPEEQARRAQQPPTVAPPPAASPFDPGQVPTNVPVDWARDFIGRNDGDYHRLDSAYESERQSKAQPQPQSVAQQWNAQPVAATPTVDPAVTAQNNQRDTELWNQLKQRATQGLNVDPNGDGIRPQVDAYRAEEVRANRNMLADLAESAGPLANLRGEQRMGAERIGQRVGGMRAQLMGQELQAKRDEVAQSLQMMAGRASQADVLEMQEKLALYDDAIKRMGIGLQEKGLDQDWKRALMQNDQFFSSLGLQAEDRDSYWDALRRGLLN